VHVGGLWLHGEAAKQACLLAAYSMHQERSDRQHMVYCVLCCVTQCVVLDCSNLHVHKPPWIAQPKPGVMLSHATVFVLPVRAMFDIGVDDVNNGTCSTLARHRT
jgi:hypothetical protein